MRRNICSYKFRVYVDVKGQIVAQEVFLTLKFILEDQVIKKKKKQLLYKSTQIPLYKYTVNNLASVELRVRIDALSR